MLKYKGYSGEVKYDDEAEIFHGEVTNVKAVLTFQGCTVDEIKTAFRETIDDYLDWCRERGKEPEKPFSGHLILRISSDLHEQIYQAAHKSDRSLNAWIMETLNRAVNKPAENRNDTWIDTWIAAKNFLKQPEMKQNFNLLEHIFLVPGPIKSEDTSRSVDSSNLRNLSSSPTTH